VLLRGDEEHPRAARLGIAPERTAVTGNTKFDALAGTAPTAAEIQELRAALGLPPGAPVLVAGSTHEGEEVVLLDVFKALRAVHPDLRLVLAPRYIERAARLVGLARDAGYDAALRTHGNERGAPVAVLDTIGELRSAYGLATIVFVGGSFTTRGGQNILEPAAQGRPVFFGPHMENFRDAVRVLVGRGAIQVKDGAQLARVMGELLARPDQLQLQGLRAAEAVREVSGAADENVARLARLLEG
jgi:3-deoxy-D-manno-octulosonic-acid transferase